ncbi:hypothetical protein PUN28_015450 [Cardiocondyla obscurior]|uniref:Uncharacterized protein n=1 Tax=Cardiocondyla obscurior TaxID=286306 RepID=A0AAW2EXI1_9HYME
MGGKNNYVLFTRLSSHIYIIQYIYIYIVLIIRHDNAEHLLMRYVQRRETKTPKVTSIVATVVRNNFRDYRCKYIICNVKKSKCDTYDIVRHDRRIRVYLQAVVVADLLADVFAARSGAHLSVCRAGNRAGGSALQRNVETEDEPLVTSSQVGPVDTSTGLHRLGRPRESYEQLPPARLATAQSELSPSHRTFAQFLRIVESRRELLSLGRCGYATRRSSPTAPLGHWFTGVSAVPRRSMRGRFPDAATKISVWYRRPDDDEDDEPRRAAHTHRPAPKLQRARKGVRKKKNNSRERKRSGRRSGGKSQSSAPGNAAPVKKEEGQEATRRGGPPRRGEVVTLSPAASSTPPRVGSAAAAQDQ